MTDQNLSDLLEGAAERTQVGPPPVELMVAGARRTRRRRAMLLTASTVAGVVAVVGGTTLLSLPSSTSHDPLTPSHSPSSSPSVPGEPTGKTDLTGTWTVSTLVGAGGQSVLPASARGKVRLTFADGRITGTTGCNDVFGTYQQSGNTGQDLRFPRSKLGSTLVGCSDEPPLVSRLLAVRHVSGSAGIRTLHAANWMIVIQLRRM